MSAPHRRPPYWTLIALVALLGAPAWGTVAAIALTATVLGIRGWRALAAAHGRDQKTPRAGEIALGTDRDGRPVFLSERELSAHGLILGASGAGKTTTLLAILTDRIACGRPVVAIDLKGSPAFARELASAAAAAGRPFRLWTPDGPASWNPLQHGNPTELKDKLIATERFTEPHYQRAAERYVLNVLQVLRAVRPEQPPTLADVVTLMDPARLPRVARSLPAERQERVLDYLAGLTPDQLSAIRGLQTRLAILTESDTGRFLDGGESGAVDLRAALAGEQVVLFSLNSSTYGKLSAQLGTLAVQDLICATGHRLSEHSAGRTLAQATIAIDECSALGGDQFVALFARCREAGVSVLASTQEMADFDRAAPGLRDQILGNTAVKIAHRQDVPSSAQTIAQMVGTEKAWEETRQIGGPLLTPYRGARGSRRLAEQFIVHPNEIKSLATGQAVLISKLRGERAATVRISPPRRTRDGPDAGLG